MTSETQIQKMIAEWVADILEILISLFSLRQASPQNN